MTRTAKDLIEAAKAEIEEIAPKDAQERIDAGAVPIDVREPDELAGGCVPGAINIPRGLLEMQIGAKTGIQDADAPFILYCKGGGRGALATRTLKDMGYTNVCSLAGGYGAWVEAGLPVQLGGPVGDEEE